jgi:hypothetical protein
MQTRIVVAVALLALAVSAGARNVQTTSERHAQFGDPTKRHATPRPQVTPGNSAGEQRNDARRPVQPFGAFKK